MRMRHPACGPVVALVAVGLFSLSAGEAKGVVTTSGCAAATVCTFAELFAGGTITVNDKLFADWELEFIDPDGVSPNFNLMVVEGKDDGGLNPGPGLQFSGSGELVVVGSDRLDMAFGFTVTVLDPELGIHDNSLTILADNVVGSAFLTVGEFVADGNGVGLGQKEVETDPAFSPPIVSDAIEFPVQQMLIIEKDILLQATGMDFAELDMFEQRYSQVPEPEALLMLGVGVGALFALCKLRGARDSDGR